GERAEASQHASRAQIHYPRGAGKLVEERAFGRREHDIQRKSALHDPLRQVHHDALSASPAQGGEKKRDRLHSDPPAPRGRSRVVRYARSVWLIRIPCSPSVNAGASLARRIATPKAIAELATKL